MSNGIIKVIAKKAGFMIKLKKSINLIQSGNPLD